MKTAYALAEHGKVVLRQKEIGGPGPGEVLLKAEFSSMSPGTEHTLLSGQIVPLPQSVGYSMAARVVEAGEGVTGFSPGDPVVTTGEHAQYLLQDARAVTPVPHGADMEQAAFFNLAHTGIYAVRRSNLQFGEPALVMGQGFVGSITAQIAKAAGALPLIVTDLDDRRLAISRRMGVHYAVNMAKEPEKLDGIIEGLGLGGIPVVLEATGARGPLEQAFDIVSERGRVVMISQAHGGDNPAYSQKLMMKGASLIGTYVNSKPFSLWRTDLCFEESWPPAVKKQFARYGQTDVWSSDADIRVYLNMIRYGALDIRPLISHRFHFEGIPEAYRMVWERDPELLGGLISWL